MDDRQAHLHYVVPLAPYASSTETFFSAARPGTRAGDEEILSELGRRAEAAQDTAAAAQYRALALAHSNRAPEAVSLFQELVEAFPDHDGYRLNLSVTYAQIGQLELCESELNEIARRSTDPDVLADAMARLGAVAADRHDVELAARHAALQGTVLRKKAREGTATQEDYFFLGRQLVGTAVAGGDEAGWSEATSLLESASERFPDDVRFLELLATGYLVQEQDERLDSLMSRIETLSPESPMLTPLKAFFQGRAPRTLTSAPDGERQAQAWLQQALEDRPSAQEAVEELGRLANRFPMNPRYRMFYALALFTRGHHDEALRQADVLAPLVGADYIANYNIGQIYALCGQPVKGQHHLEIALAAARTQEDRADANKMLSDARELSAG